MMGSAVPMVPVFGSTFGSPKDYAAPGWCGAMEREVAAELFVLGAPWALMTREWDEDEAEPEQTRWRLLVSAQRPVTDQPAAYDVSRVVPVQPPASARTPLAPPPASVSTWSHGVEERRVPARSLTAHREAGALRG